MTMPKSNRRRARALSATIAALSVLGLTGCSPPYPDRPDVVWPEGEPSGKFEDDPWVQALRASDLELAVAEVTRDLTDPALFETTSASGVSNRWQFIKRQARNEEWTYPAGPAVMIPLMVEEDESGQFATVTYCRASDWRLSVESPEVKSLEDLDGDLAQTRVSLREDGQRGVGGSNGIGGDVERDLLDDYAKTFLDSDEDNQCSLDEAAYGLFDPPPDVTVKYSPDDFKLPEPGYQDLDWRRD